MSAPRIELRYAPRMDATLGSLGELSALAAIYERALEKKKAVGRWESPDGLDAERPENDCAEPSIRD